MIALAGNFPPFKSIAKPAHDPRQSLLHHEKVIERDRHQDAKSASGDGEEDHLGSSELDVNHLVGSEQVRDEPEATASITHGSGDHGFRDRHFPLQREEEPSEQEGGDDRAFFDHASLEGQVAVGGAHNDLQDHTGNHALQRDTGSERLPLFHGTPFQFRPTGRTSVSVFSHGIVNVCQAPAYTLVGEMSNNKTAQILPKREKSNLIPLNFWLI